MDDDVKSVDVGLADVTNVLIEIFKTFTNGFVMNFLANVCICCKTNVELTLYSAEVIIMPY